MFGDGGVASTPGLAADCGFSTQLAQAAGTPIGTVEETTGTVTLTRADGTNVGAGVGEPVFANDVVTTGPASSVEIRFVDDTRFSLGQNGRMTLDQLVFNPGAGGELDLSVVQGAFTFVTGAIAGAPGEGMEVEIPVGVIGIRGTTVGCGEGGGGWTCALLPDPDGSTGRVVFTNAQGEVILDQALEATMIPSALLAPGQPVIVPRDQLVALFGNALQNLPDIIDQIDLLQSPEDESNPEAGEQRGEAVPTAPNTGGVNAEAGETQSLDEMTTLFTLSDEQGFTTEPAGLGASGGFAPSGGLGDSGEPGGPADNNAGLSDGPTDTSDPSIVTPPSPGPTVIAGGPGDDELDASGGGPAEIIGLAGNDTLIGSPGNDILTGGDGDDTLDAGAGDDQVSGEGGNDLIIGGSGEGNDALDGGPGIDTVQYSSATQPISVNLASGTASGDPAIGQDTLDEIENVVGGQADDTIIGNAAANTLDGGAGNDVLNGQSADDTLIGGSGDDQLTGGAGNDALAGGAGSDTAVYSGAAGAYVIAVDAEGAVTVSGPDGADSLTGVEFLSFADQLVSVAELEPGTNQAPTAITLSINTITENAAGAVVGVLSVTDPDMGDSHSFTVSDGRFEVIGGALRLKPGEALDFEAEPQVTLTVTATDSGGLSVSQSFTITVGDVDEVNDPPTAGDDSGFVTVEDTPLVIAADALTDNDSDPEDDALTITAVGSAVGGTVAINGEGQVVFTPDTEFSGSASFTYTITDGQGGVDTGEVSLTVTPVNDDPDAVDDGPLATAENTSVSIAVLANDSDIDGDELSVTSVGAAVNGTAVVNGDGTITYTPNAGFSGSDSFIYTISDGQGGTDTATVTINVIANVPPTASDVAYEGAEDAGAIPVILTGGDVDGAVAVVELVSLPTNGTLYSNPEATIPAEIGVSYPGNSVAFYFVPAAEFHGQVTFQYTVLDDDGAADPTPATATITIAPINDAPVPASLSATVATGGIYQLGGDELEVTDNEEGPAEIVYTIVSTPSRGMLRLSNVTLGVGSTFTQADIIAGLLVYAHDGSVQESESFIVDISDGTNVVVGQPVAITVVHHGVIAEGEATVGDTIIVGDSGYGRLDVVGGTDPIAGQVTIGNQSGGDGLIRVSGISGPDSSLRVGSGGMVVGNQGEGVFQVEEFADVEIEGEKVSLTIGALPGSDGRVTVSGSGSTLITKGTDSSINVVHGELRVEAGGLVSSLWINIGAQAESNGAVTVAGVGSKLVASNDFGLWSDSADYAGYIEVGGEGDSHGSLSILDGGIVEVRSGIGANAGTHGSAMVVGRAIGSVGTVVLSGSGTNLAVTQDPTVQSDPGNLKKYLQGPNIIVGRMGLATMTVTAGAEVEIAGNEPYFGVGNGNIDKPQDDTVLLQSLLTISNGGKVSVTETLTGAAVTNSGGVTIGDFLNGNGRVLVTGAESELTVHGTGTQILVGHAGDGILDVQDGGLVGSLYLAIGWADKSNGVVNINGPQSKIELTNDFGLYRGETDGFAAYANVGYEAGSRGELNITDGGSLHISQGAAPGVLTYPGLTLGENVGSEGYASVSGNDSTITIGDNLQSFGSEIVVGRKGFGTLSVSEHAVVTVQGTNEPGLQIAREAGSFGEVVVDGAGSQIVVTGIGQEEHWGPYIDVGIGGDAVFTVSNGGSVLVTGDQARLGVSEWSSGPEAGAGSVRITGPGSTLSVLGAGASVFIGDTGAGLVLIENGGALHAGAAHDGESDIYVYDSGALDIDGGLVAGDVELEGGELRLAGDGIGSETLDGNLLSSRGWSTLAVDVAGSGVGSHDLLTVTGDVNLTVGVISFTFLDGYLPVAGDSFTFLAASSLVYDPAAVSFEFWGVDESFEFSVAQSGSSLVFTALSNAVAAAGLTHFGGSSDGRIVGSEESDYLLGGAGDDAFDGGDGDDYLIGGDGFDSFWGGAGSDTIDVGTPEQDGVVGYWADPSGVIINLSGTTQLGVASGTVRDGFGDTDTLIGAFNVAGSEFADTILGGAADEFIHGEGGDDFLDGGAGWNSLDFFGSADGVAVDLNIQDGVTSQLISESQGTDTIVNFSTVLGSFHEDTIIGTAGENYVGGRGGHDTFVTGGGNDGFDGDEGDDRIILTTFTFGQLNGGVGEDTIEIAGADEFVDLTAIGTAFTGFERIDITGSGNNTIVLSAADVLSLSDTDELVILGNAGDVYALTDENWAFGGTRDIDGELYNVFTNASAPELATLLVDADMSSSA